MKENFKACVSKETQNNLKSLAILIQEEFISEQGWGGAYCISHVNEISGVSYDGYFAFQDGGYEVTEFYRSDIDSSYHFTKEQTKEMERMEKLCFEWFRDSRKELNLPEDYGYDDIPEEFQNDFAEYESEFFEPALLRYSSWVKGDTVFLALALNYRDQPYYRAKSDEDLFQIEVNTAQFNRKPKEFWLKLMQRKMKSVA